MWRLLCSVLLISFMASAFASAIVQEDPKSYAVVEVSNCGKLGRMTSSGGGGGSKSGKNTKIKSAGFDVECQGGGIGEINIQTSDNEERVVSYRKTKHQGEYDLMVGRDTRALVRQAIKKVCDCR